MFNPRPLAPAPGGTLGPATTPQLQRRRNTGTACTACKTRKLKCSGQSPCPNCLRNGFECEINLENDKRRKLSLKRKLQGLEQDRNLLLELLTTLREREDRYVLGLINRVRNDASLEDIRSYLGDRIGGARLERTLDLAQDYDKIRRLQQSARRQSALDVKRLSDDPLLRVPSRPWTTITDDDGFVSHLLSLWLAWSAPFFNWVDTELFLNDMKSGKGDSGFCSPFLVNAILAQGCIYSDYPEAYEVPNDPSSKGMHFWKEAKRLLDAEEGKVTIPTTQGVGVMYSFTCTMGKDRLSLLYIVQMAEHMRELRSSQHSLIASYDLPAERVSQALDRMELGMFSATTASCFNFQKSAKMEKPAGVRLKVHEHDQELWAPYPRQGEPVLAHSKCLINQMASLNEVAWDVSHVLFGDDDNLTRADLEEKVHGWHRVLLEWSRNIPPCMDYRRSRLPGVLLMHMFYHMIIMRIFSRLREPVPVSDESALARAESATETCFSSARAMSDIMEMQRSEWGLDTLPFVNMQ